MKAIALAILAAAWMVCAILLRCFGPMDWRPAGACVFVAGVFTYMVLREIWKKDSPPFQITYTYPLDWWSKQ